MSFRAEPLLALAGFALVLTIAGCGSDTTPGGTGTPDAAAPDLAQPVGVDSSLVVLDHVTHLGGQLTQDGQPVTLPSGLYSKITMHIEFTCPKGGCDPYDRIGSIRKKTGDAQKPVYVEIGRYITPFGVKGAWDIDVTELAPMLTAGPNATTGIFSSYDETYAQNGAGAVVTVTLQYKGGVPSPIPVWVLPIDGWNRLPVGEPMIDMVDKSLPPAQVTLGGGATSARVRLFVTGHGQGNSYNCAEFCDLQHSLLVDGKVAEAKSIWRDDCGDNPLSNQRGTWQYPREGWCPGSDVHPWTVDLGARGAPFKLSYGMPGNQNAMGGIDPYVNTCSPSNCSQRNCALGTTCDYDGGAHTEPNFFISAVVIGYQ